jgi:hypothetical protein
MRKYVVRTLVFVLITFFPLASTAQLISFTASNQNQATVGFEMNEYDWMLNPVYYGLLNRSALHFALDGAGFQLGTDTAGTGFRAGYAWIMQGFSPLLMMDYSTAATTSTAAEEDNIQFTYTDFDSASGRYATITETASPTTTNLSPAQKLVAFFGGKLDGPVQFDVELEWLLDKTTLTSLSYTNTYTDAANATESTLTSKGNRTDTTVSLRNNSSANALALEGEIGLVFGSVSSRISLGAGLMNWDFAAPLFSQVATQYSAGLDPVLRDQETVTESSGAFYYNGSAAVASFGMDTATPQYVPQVPVSLDSSTIITFDPTFTLEIPASLRLNLAPTATTASTVRTISYDDADADNPETARTEAVTTNTLAYGRNLSSSVEGLVRKSFSQDDAAVLHLGAGLKVAYTGWQATRDSSKSTHVQVDGNVDGDYADAGVDTDTTYTRSGYEIQNSNDQISTTLRVPLAVSYTPVSSLTFHAGTETSLTATLTLLSSLTTGSSTYRWEAYTDNLVSANSYAQRQIDLSAQSNIPASSAGWGFAFAVSGKFGATLRLTDSFIIDALASGSSAGFSSFRLMGVYSF